MEEEAGSQRLSDPVNCCLENDFLFVFFLPRLISEILWVHPQSFGASFCFFFCFFFTISRYGAGRSPFKEISTGFEVFFTASCFHGLLFAARYCYNVSAPSIPIRNGWWWCTSQMVMHMACYCKWNLCVLKWCYWKPFPCYFMLNIACMLPGETIWKSGMSKLAHFREGRPV